jgi:transposase-like protein
MRCERCGEDTEVQRYDVDGFTGYLCDDCRKAWDKIQAD